MLMFTIKISYQNQNQITNNFPNPLSQNETSLTFKTDPVNELKLLFTKLSW